MARGLFVTGFELEEVLAIQAKAKAFFMEGKTLMEWTDSGNTGKKAFTMSPDKVLEECSYALKLLCPEKYGRNARVSISNYSGYIAK